MNPARDLVRQLLERGYVHCMMQGDFASALQAFYLAWASFLANPRKLLEPGDPSVPWGYMPYDSPRGVDTKESFYARPETPLPECVQTATRALLPRLHEIALELTNEIEGQIPGVHIDQPARGTLRIMRYPPFEGHADAARIRAAAGPPRVRMVPHTDLNALTLLPPATVAGLQLLDEGFQWRDAEPCSGRVLVHAGQKLEAMSGRRIKATQHRVRGPLGREAWEERLSVAYFLE
jgi:2OG-Fe(II) oxygenase superfamily